MERAGDRGRDKDRGEEKGGGTLPVPPSPIPWPPAPLSGWAEGTESRSAKQAVRHNGYFKTYNIYTCLDYTT